jgi:hypothetical protein
MMTNQQMNEMRERAADREEQREERRLRLEEQRQERLMQFQMQQQLMSTMMMFVCGRNGQSSMVPSIAPMRMQDFINTREEGKEEENMENNQEGKEEE